MLAAQETEEVPAATILDTLEASYEADLADFYGQLEAMYESGNFTEVVHPIEDYFDQFRTYAKDKSIAPDQRGRAQLWCLNNFSEKNWSHPDKVFLSLTKLFVSEFANSEMAIQYCQSLRYLRLDADAKFKGIATLAASTTADGTTAYCMLAEAFAHIDNNQQKLADEKVDALLEKYPDSLAAKDAAPLLVKRQLQIGKVAPKLSGVDVDGNERHLKDTRGKVTFVVFWGFW